LRAKGLAMGGRRGYAREMALDQLDLKKREESRERREVNKVGGIGGDPAEVGLFPYLTLFPLSQYKHFPTLKALDVG
jgi:hypothetical protein